MRNISKAIQINPDYAKTYYNRGNAYSEKGDHDRVIEDYSRAIELNPDFVEAYRNRGITLSIKGEHDLAIQDFSKMIQLQPQSAHAYYNRGILWLRLKNWEKAKSDLTFARNKGADINALFQNSFISYSSIEDFEQKHNVKLPEDIVAMLTPP